MTDHEDRFAASLDALSRGEPPAPNDDLTQFVTEARSTWSNPTDLPPGSPPRLSATDRRHLWTAIQQEAAIKPSASIHEGRHVMSATSPTVQATSNQPTGWGANISRWQPVLSMTVMFVVLAVLVGIAYTGLDHTDDELPAISLAALTDEATPTAGMECVPYGPPVRSSSELRDMSPSDWPAREYMTMAAADPEIAQRAAEVYENWVACYWAHSTESSVSQPPVEILQFWSDRMQYVFMLRRGQSFASAEQAELLQPPSIGTLLQHGALPLNRPVVEIVNPITGESLPSFLPGDVYELSDGRYGVVIGSISTDQLVGSGSASSENEEGVWLTFLAFVEVDGYLLIDEYTSLCVPVPALPPAETADLAACTQPSNGIEG
jgi:hypothetical protein